MSRPLAPEVTPAARNDTEEIIVEDKKAELTAIGDVEIIPIAPVKSEELLVTRRVRGHVKYLCSHSNRFGPCRNYGATTVRDSSYCDEYISLTLSSKSVLQWRQRAFTYIVSWLGIRATLLIATFRVLVLLVNRDNLATICS